MHQIKTFKKKSLEQLEKNSLNDSSCFYNENKTIINEPTATDSKAVTDKQETTKVSEEVQQTNETINLILMTFYLVSILITCKIFKIFVV